MEENLQKDELERFFKSTFEKADQNPQGADWDIPPDDLWAGIEQGLPAAKAIPLFLRLSSNWKSIAATFALLVIALGAWAIYQRQLDLEDRIAEQVQSLENLEQKIDDIHKENNEVTNRNVELYKFPKHIYKSTEDNEKTSRIPSVINQPTENNINRITNLPEKEEVTTRSEIVKQLIDNRDDKEAKSSFQKGEKLEPLENLEKDLLDDQNRNEFTIAKTESADYKRVLFGLFDPLPTKVQEVTKLDSNFSLPIAVVEAEISKQRKWRLAAFAGFSQQRRVTDKLLPIQVGMRDLSGTMVESGVAMSLQLNRELKNGFWVSTGLHLNRISKSMEIEGKINFRSDNEQEVGQELRSTYQVTALSTPASDGEIIVELDRPKNGPAIPQNKEIELDIKVTNQVNYLSIPIQLGYDLIKEEDTDLIVKAGIAVGFMEESFTPRIKARNFNFDHKFNARPRIKNVRNTYGEIMLGVDWSKAISNTLRFHIQPSLRKSINPIYESKRFSTDNIIVDAQLGLSYSF